MTLIQALPKAGRFTYSLYQLFWSSIDILFPPACGGCDRAGVRWCQECNQKVETISPACCQICGQKLSNSDICPRCNSVRPIFSHLRSWAVFNNEIRNAIHKLKYRKDMSLGEILSRPLIELISSLPWEIDIVMPVPLSDERQKERGYNQAALIAFPIALSMGLKYHTKALRRVRDTVSQVGLSFDDRHINVSGAFAADQRIVYKKNILIVDDVATSGATLNACAEALLVADAKEVNAVTLARAEYNNN
jgi:competence protein ComFC